MYGRFRTGDNRPDTEGKEIATILALESIAKSLSSIVDYLRRAEEREKNGKQSKS